MRTRFLGMAILLAVLVGMACGLPGRLASFIAATPTPTSTSTPTPVPVQSDVAVVQILLRYDSQQPLGTLEATLCNLGEEDFEGALQVVFQANGRTYTVDVSPTQAQGLRYNGCIDVYPPVDFAFFGITQPGPVEVTVRLEGIPAGDPPGNHLLQERMDVRYIETKPTQEAWQRYQDCVEQHSMFPYVRENCLERLPDFPLAERDEITKRRGVFSAVGPRDQDFFLAALVMGLEACTPAVKDYLGLPRDYQVPFLVARAVHDLGAMAITSGATIQMQAWDEDAQTDWMMTEIVSVGCQPGRLVTLNRTLVHEIVHALINLYIEDEWFGYFTTYMTEEGEVLFEGEDDASDRFPLNLEEGLAYWVGDQFSEPNASVWQCTPQGARFVNFDTTVPYLPLDLWQIDKFQRWLDQNLPENTPLRQSKEFTDLYLDLRYASAKCFWDTLVQMEGREVIGKVLAQLAAYPEEDTCLYPFVEVALKPVVRPETLKVLEERFNVRPGVDACDYQ